MDAKALSITLLGSFGVQVQGRPVPAAAWRRRKAAHLVKLLALTPGHRLHREEVLELLWPALNAPAGANNLHRTLHTARHILEPSLRNGVTSSFLHLQGELLVLAPIRKLEIDADAFSRAAEAALATGSVDLCASALALYAGDLLPEDRYEDWAALRRDELRGQYHDLLRRCSQTYEASGDLPAAIKMLQCLVASEPADESAHRTLMRLYALAGERHRALQQYDLLVDALRREVDAEPDVRTQQLYDDLRVGRFGGAPLDLQPEKQLLTNLPFLAASFVGREAEMQEVMTLLTSTRLLTLTGAGGCGKSRLAVESARKLITRYRDGVWLVQLAAAARPDLVAQAIAAAIGVREIPSRRLTDTLRDAIQDREMLLILDNCEHLLDACAELAGELLSSCPRLRILATSREPLGVGSEWVWRVPSLAVPESLSLPPAHELLRYDAIHLFVDRARASRSDFTLTDQNSSAVVDICRRLDGIPLAVELAAGRLNLLSVEQVAERLEDRLDLLRGRDRTSLPRHHTLRLTIDWSHDLLGDEQQIVFRRLAAFAGGWTLEAAEEVCAGGSVDRYAVLDLLSDLVDKSLVVVTEQRSTGRYRLLEVVRQYALEKLERSAEALEVRRRHAAWCLRLAEDAERHLRGADQVAWLERLRAEDNNLRAALAWSYEQGDADLGLNIAGTLWRYWRTRGHLAEGSAWLDRMLSLSETEGHDARLLLARAKCLMGAGFLLASQGDYETSRARFDVALQLYRRLGDPLGEAEALSGQGMIHAELGDHDLASAHFQEALSLQIRHGDRHGASSSYRNLGNMAYYKGESARARTLLEKSLSLTRALGDKVGEGFDLIVLGNVSLIQGKYTMASSLYRQSLALRQEIGAQPGVVACMQGMLIATQRAGDHATAAWLLGVEEGARSRLGMALAPTDSSIYTDAISCIRDHLAPDVFARIRSQGRELPLDEAVPIILQERTHEYISSLDQSRVPYRRHLTPREREIGLLVARGITNREIAEVLALSPRTVDAHVSSIMNKLGVTSRLQVAVSMEHDAPSK